MRRRDKRREDFEEAEAAVALESVRPRLGGLGGGLGGGLEEEEQKDQEREEQLAVDGRRSRAGNSSKRTGASESSTRDKT